MRQAYTFELRYLRLLTRHLENLERDCLLFVPAFPNFDGWGDALGMIFLPRDTLKFIECWDCTVGEAQPLKFEEITSPPAWIPTLELLGRKDDQDWKERL